MDGLAQFVPLFCILHYGGVHMDHVVVVSVWSAWSVGTF